MGGNRVIWEIVVDIAEYYIGMKVGTFCGDVYAEGFWSLSREILVYFVFVLIRDRLLYAKGKHGGWLAGWSGGQY